ncbi:MAG: lipocalin family protein [Hyphomonadaceae bacterium]|nr:lipocalin family protein [Hyphomonadaceae bacterium]
MRALIPALGLMVVSGCATQPVNREPTASLAAQPVETARYLGLWHEAARLPNSFERDCVRATAEYALRDDGLISVRNTCIRADGETRDAVGRARRVDDALGKLKVSFFGPFWGDYWVIDRAEDYSWSIVGEPSGRYLWVLTRADSISADERAAFEARLRELGYDTEPLIWNEGFASF